MKAAKSGIQVNPADVPFILAMIAREDRKHDIAAWFGLNQGRIAEVEEGKHGNPALARADQLPPSGSPGPRARELRGAVARVHAILTNQGAVGVPEAIQRLAAAMAEFDRPA